MQVKVVDCYENLVKKAFDIVKNTVKRNPYAVLGLATGNTMLGLYRLMTDDCKQNGTSYKHIRTINLDEYKGLSKSDERSYAYFMRKNLFDKLDLTPGNTYIQDGVAENEEAECERYNKLLEGLPRDLQILGIGNNGHIAFNEPDTDFGSQTHVAELSKSTIKANSGMFKNISEVPEKAFTIGIKNIMQAKQIVLLASGRDKADAVFKLVKGEVTEKVPASVLQLHPNCIVLVDKAAGRFL